MDTLAIFGLQFTLSVVVFGLLAKWYAAPWLADKTLNAALMLLIIPHAFRHLGMAFMVPGLVGDALPGGFAMAAAYGDLFSGLLAILALIALRHSWVLALSLVWVFNLFGSIDLVNALRQAEVVPQLGTTWYIPTFVVPLLLVTHVMIFARLLKGGQRA